MRFRCTNCQGEYDDRGPDGLQYYHACPAGRVLVGDIFIQFPERSRRDENIGDRGGIKAEGRGRSQIREEVR